MEPCDYVAQLPVKHIREIHVSGIQRIDSHWVAWARRRGIDEGLIQRIDGQVSDHLPMTNQDWEFFGWAVEQIQGGFWGEPWVVTFEYGGVGRPHSSITDAEVLAEQVPRLYGMVHNSS
jgi:uncharacterized protein (UPF0276 family)